jgi:hypothetical protein
LHGALCADYAALGDWSNALAHARLADIPGRGAGFFYTALTRDVEVEAYARAGEGEHARRLLAQIAELSEAVPRLGPVLARARQHTITAQ